MEPIMPIVGTAWTDQPQALIESGPNEGFKKNTCVWNVAWNQLHAQGKGAEKDPNRVAAAVRALVNQFNDDVAKGKIKGPRISNPNNVTTGQLTAIAKVADADNTAGPASRGTAASAPATPYHPFIGPLPVGVPRPVVDNNGRIIPGSNAGSTPPGVTDEWPFIGPLAPGVTRPLVDSKGNIVPGSNAGNPPA